MLFNWCVARVQAARGEDARQGVPVGEAEAQARASLAVRLAQWSLETLAQTLAGAPCTDA